MTEDKILIARHLHGPPPPFPWTRIRNNGISLLLIVEKARSVLLKEDFL